MTSASASTNTNTTTGTSTGTGTNTTQAWARGGMILAATLMLIIGVYQIFVGIAAIVADDFFVVSANYAYEMDTTAWGWIHLIIGALAAIAGFALFTGAGWARAVAIALAGISAVANFFFLPYYPIWSLLIIALDIFAIWAIATARGGHDAIVGIGDAAGGASFSGGAPQSGDRWPAENTAAGRHWAPDNVKEGVAGAGQTAQGAAAAAQEKAASAARAAGGSMPSNRQQPPTRSSR